MPKNDDKPNTTSYPVTVTDGVQSINSSARTDRGSDKSIVSFKPAKRSVLRGIGRLTKVDTVTFRVALKPIPPEVQTYIFSLKRAPPGSSLQLFTSLPELINVIFLVSNCKIAIEDLFIGSPVLDHLGINTNTMLQQKRNLLCVIDRSSVRHLPSVTHGGSVRHLMHARMTKENDVSDGSAMASTTPAQTNRTFQLSRKWTTTVSGATLNTSPMVRFWSRLIKTNMATSSKQSKTIMDNVVDNGLPNTRNAWTLCSPQQ